MELTVGAVLEGKVKSITNFGAFISLPENKTGMVHISEVANTYVSDIRQHLTEGQEVKVMVISAEAGKVNLSIKRLEAKPQRENARPAQRPERIPLTITVMMVPATWSSINGAACPETRMITPETPPSQAPPR